jgi:acyl-CoA thioesterase I
MKLLIFSLLLFVTNTIAASKQNILIFGDSLSAGYGIAREQSWPSLLAQKLAASRSNYAVINASISGETTAGGLSRLPQALHQHQPTIVVIALGANDGLRGLPLTAMRGNLDAMIKDAKRSKAKILLVGMKLPPNYGPDYTAQFAQIFVDMAKTEKIALLPFLLEPISGQRDAFQADDLHPVADVQATLLEHVMTALHPLLVESRP